MLACSSEDSSRTGIGGDGGRSGTGGAGMGGTGGVPTGLCAPGSGAVELAGRWAVQADLRVEISGNRGSLVRVCPDPQTQASTMFLQVELSGSGSSLSQTVSMCDVSLPAVTSGVGSCPQNPADYLETRVSPSPALTRHFPAVSAGPSSAGISAAQALATYRPAPFALIMGTTLADAVSDPLPRWDSNRSNCAGLATSSVPADCVVDWAKVIDGDQDGKPGVTVNVKAIDSGGSDVISGDGYAVMRVAPEPDGTVMNADCVMGTLTAKLEFEIVDSDIVLSGAEISTAAVNQQLPPLRVLPESKFKMLRADGQGDHDFDDDNDGTITCAEIKNHAQAFAK
jgi:hypothetical protein